MGKSTISMAIFNSYVDITRGYPSSFFRQFRGQADLEATLWFEHLCCGLLSPEAEAHAAGFGAQVG